MRIIPVILLFPSTLIALVIDAPARPRAQYHQWTAPEVEIDRVGDVDGTHPAPRKALQDTTWIADWTFDSGAPCADTGWTHVDNHVLFTGNVYWHVESGFTTPGGMSGNSFAVGYHDNFCCEDPDGYDNDWYQGIRIPYQGAATLSFDYIVDSEAGFDFLQIETDSACASYDQVDFDVDPSGTPAAFRSLVVSADGVVTNGQFSEALSDYTVPGTTHCAYIAFFSDGGFSPCDGDNATSVGEGAVVDNIEITDGNGTRTEDFEDGTLDIGTAVDMADPIPFGTWARLFHHVTDNDLCVENTTCAWLWSDDTTPTLANDPSMGFGPGSYVIKNWLDDIIVSPWVSLSSTANANATIIEFRRFPGNFFSTSRIVQNWSVRGKGQIMGQECVGPWGHVFSWNSLSLFAWITWRWDMTPYFDPTLEFIQIRHRTSDWQWIAGAPPPLPLIPGPGPYVDRTRIGRRILTGPVLNEGIDSRSQAQDCFPSEIDPQIVPGEHYRPTTDRFGTCAFSEGTELGIGNSSPRLITGDSIWINVEGVRPGGEVVTSVEWSGAVVTGPHVGKAPPPYTVGANGFFTTSASPVLNSRGAIFEDFYFIDLDDSYFRGGDRLLYFWSATDNGGGYSSDPTGLTAPPASVAEAEEITQGLLEVSFLPTINWDSAYLARIQADSHGDLDPTTEELANSSQANCILYYQHNNPRRRSGDVNRTSFMYALDRLGYKNHYDVYDEQGYGNTNNQLGGRATIEQCQGYNLIIMDAGNRGPGSPILPNGLDLDAQKVDQATWFMDWLAQASLSEAQWGTLWFIGSDVLDEGLRYYSGSGAVLLSTIMGLSQVSSDQGLDLNPEVAGVASFTFDQGTGSVLADFTGDSFVLQGGCPVIRNYDAAAANAASAVATHRYRSPTTHQLGDAAIVMNRNDAEAYNTIMQTHPWFDIRDAAGTPANPAPELALLQKILNSTLHLGCLQAPDPSTDRGPGDVLDVPARTVLHANTPNPFNPTTTIRFDLARSGHVTLRIYDVAGRLVRTLLDEERLAGFDQRVTWDGQDDSMARVSSGVYFFRLDAAGAHLNRKMVVLK